MAVEGITHRRVEVNGINMHIAEKGEGPVVLLVHGFPELWYSWRHQITALAAAGYRAVAPDLRGYGETDAPQSPAEYSIFHIVGDLVALIDVLGQDQVFVVGHDWGASIAWQLSLFRPDKVRALVNMSVAFSPRSSKGRPLQSLRATFGQDYYIVRFQDSGAAEALFAKHGEESLFKRFFSYREPAPLFISYLDITPGEQVHLPPWLTEEDIRYYASRFEKTGFTPALNYYRSMDRNWELTAPWAGAQIKVPTKFIVGDLDLTYHSPGVQDYIQKGGFKRFVPLLEEVVVMKEVGHFINEEKPEEINDHIISFLQKF
ncbi:epoxide hydrolase 3-like [Wolffia australiana]